ncbi:DUF3800 domain-containing protein [Nesterenkonia sp. NBAIMH1]|uniref:DUF3800 domain-containing protein n=1 Tax=Nesterenkonia sp. NBAIMH1 TaxID=2600320 RepID=UPI0011B5CC4B|nr:DUF3800 domain-containing protein [Nesterenkonia sp. NBAIMH1]
MLHAYIDESERDEDYYFLGAVIGYREQIFDMGEALKAVMRKHAKGIPQLKYTDELHGSDLISASEKPWQGLMPRLRWAIMLDALVAIERSKVRIYIEGIDINEHRARPYKTHFPAREVALNYLLEKIQSCSKPHERVQVHADDHHTAEQSRSNFARYQREGTFGWKSTTLDCLMPDILFEDSKYELGLQAADLVTWLYNRRMTMEERNEDAAKWRAKFWKAIRPAMSGDRGNHRVWP